MKIVLFLNKDIEANIAYNLIKSELLNHSVRIYYSDTVGISHNKPKDLTRLEYYEKEFVFNNLSKFINDNKITSSFEFFDNSFKSFPIEKCSDVNSLEFINEIRELSPDLFISIRFGKIFKDEIINIPKQGLINLHSAILPDYRGIMGTLQAIKQKSNKIGCTLHTIPNSGIDTGEIIEIAKLNVNHKKSLFWNIVQLYPLGAELIIKNVKKLNQNSSLNTQKQNLDAGSYFSIPTKSDFEQIKTLGMEIISVKDYQEVLSDFILKDLSAMQKKQLKTIIKTSELKF